MHGGIELKETLGHSTPHPAKFLFRTTHPCFKMCYVVTDLVEVDDDDVSIAIHVAIHAVVDDWRAVE